MLPQEDSVSFGGNGIAISHEMAPKPRASSLKRYSVLSMKTGCFQSTILFKTDFRGQLARPSCRMTFPSTQTWIYRRSWRPTAVIVACVGPHDKDAKARSNERTRRPLECATAGASCLVLMKLLHIKKHQSIVKGERTTTDPNMIKDVLPEIHVQFILNYSLQRFAQEPEALRTWPFATFEPFSGRVLIECSQDCIDDKLFLHPKYLFMSNFMAKCQKSPSHISELFNAL